MNWMPRHAEIDKNLQSLRRRIHEACGRAGRDPGEVRLVAVTKGQAAEILRAAYDVGLRDFGENRVEEALPKQEALQDLSDIRWHMVGHIQSRKAQRVAQSFGFVHSVDSSRIARHLDRFSREALRCLPILLECNVSGEESKYGWPMSDRTRWDEAAWAFKEICALPGLEVRGLMTMAPFTQDMNVVRGVFTRMRELRDWLAPQLPNAMKELSMGMTDDFEVAIEEGATMVRIGRAIFGERQV